MQFSFAKYRRTVRPRFAQGCARLVEEKIWLIQRDLQFYSFSVTIGRFSRSYDSKLNAFGFQTKQKTTQDLLRQVHFKNKSLSFPIGTRLKKRQTVSQTWFKPNPSLETLVMGHLGLIQVNMANLLKVPTCIKSENALTLP